MSNRARRILLSVLATMAVFAAAPLTEAGTSALATPICAAGTNWDNVIGACR